MSQGSGTTGGPADQPEPLISVANRDDGTIALPPRLVPKPSLNPADKRMPGWLVGIFAVLALVVIAVPSVLYAQIGNGQNPTSSPATCDTTTTPCQAAQAYLSAYTSGNYEAMYKLVSAASITRFSDKTILGGNYSDAHDYIVSRTAAILNQAEVYTITATTGAERSTDATHATIPAHIVMHTIHVGTITQDILLPLVLEKSKWLVDWSPGLIFAALSDSADPHFQRLVRLCAANAARGRILAGDGTVLADDETVYQFNIVPGQIASATTFNQTLGQALGYTTGQIAALYQGAGATEAVAVPVELTQSHYNQVSASLAPLANKGLEISQTTGRVYPFGADLAAVTGYVQQVSNQDLLNDPNHYYELGDTIGRAGVEQWAEQQLRPAKGGDLDIVPPNNGGGCAQATYTIARQTAIPGNDVHTTINVKLQQTAMASMRAQNKSAGTVALNPADGAVLVLASNPMYNPNDFSLGFTPAESAAFNALDHPYLNRAVSGTYPIGSVFKIVTLAAALEHGTSLNDTIDCTGSFQLPGVNHTFIDDLPTGHGSITIYQGLAASCDVVFWTLAAGLNQKDPNILPTMARAFGYGALTHIVGLPDGEEQAGVVPDPAYVQQVTGGGWSAVDALNLAVGQGYFLATPLQVADVAAEVGNGGVRWQPRLVSAVTRPDGTTVTSYQPAKLADLVGDKDITADHLTMLQVAMLGPTTDPLGTVHAAFRNYPILVAGKTGTAQTSTPLPDALFVAYAPASPVSGPPVTPKIAIGTIIEYSGFGEIFGAPIARDLISAYLLPG